MKSIRSLICSHTIHWDSNSTWLDFFGNGKYFKSRNIVSFKRGSSLHLLNKLEGASYIYKVGVSCFLHMQSRCMLAYFMLHTLC
jgi:hypothetical protein